MPTFEITSPDGRRFRVTGPDGSTAEQALQQVQQQVGAPQQPMMGESAAAAHYDAAGMPKPKGFMDTALDFVKAIPRGMVTGAVNAPNPSMVPMQDYELEMAPIRAGAAQTLKAQLPASEGRAGRFGEAVGEAVGSPVSYLGPGSLLLKTGGAALSAAGSEAGGQLAEGTRFETPARIGGALAGGVTAAKALGPGAPKAAIPTSSELFEAGGTGYQAARNTGLVVKPDAVSSWATRVEQELIGPDHGFTGGRKGTAKETIAALADLQSPPAGGTITASNLDALRKHLGHIAEKVQLAGPGGTVKPTADAAAASITLKRLGEFAENLPPGSVVAGDAAAYVRATREANANWAAGERTRDFDARLTKAERATDRQIAGSLDSQIKNKAGQLLDNPKKTKGLTKEELAQLNLINSGNFPSNFLRQLGRGGAGVIPLGTHAVTAGPLATMTGGASVLPQLGLMATLYGARKGSEAITKNRAQTLAEMLAKRSPLYEQRAANLPPPDLSPQVAAILRSLFQQ